MRKILILSILILCSISFKINQITADPQQCIAEKCPNEWAACQKDPKCIPALQDCQKKCGTGSTCWAFCLSKEGDTPATNVAKCANSQGCLKESQVLQTAIATVDPQQCIEEKCPNEWAACQKDPKCIPTLQNCQKKCKTNSTCWGWCLTQAGDSAAKNVAKCANDKGCLKESQVLQTAIATVDPQQCIEEKCPNEWAACQKDPKCIPALQSCQKKCGSSTSCWTFCLPGKGSQPAIDVAKCAQKNNCLGVVLDENALAHPFEICMSRFCFSESLNCLSEEECRHSLLYCRDPEGVWLFSMQCLIHRSLSNQVLSSWFHCVGNRKCI